MLEIINQPENYLFLLFIGIFFLTLLLLPRIRQISIRKGILDTPDERSSHKDIVPTFGGVSFYIALMFTLFFTQKLDKNNIIVTLMASMSIIFFTGLKDDLKNLSPKIKMLGQVVAVSLLMIHSEFRIETLHGFLNIYELHAAVSIPLTLFLIIGLINAYNLIDGIDGMASITGIVVSISFGFLFYSLGLYFYLGICVALVSMLFAFLRYNFSSRKKIFMGDTGSLLIGMVLGLLAMKLSSIGFETVGTIAISRSEIPLLLLGILIIPAFDISRVILIRITKGVPVFSPDRNHIHHVLVDSGLSHKQASLTVGLINIIIISLIYFSIQKMGVLFAIIVFFILLTILSCVLFIINRRYNAIKSKVKLRKYLFKITNFFNSPKKSKFDSNKRRLLFNQRLKKIKILFF